MQVPDGPLANVPQETTHLFNSTAIQPIFEKMGNKFDMMYAKKAYVHWFLKDGIDEEEFVEARDVLEDLLSCYNEVAKIDKDENDEEKPEEVETK